MRIVLTVAMAVLFVQAGPIAAQAKGKNKLMRVTKSRDILASLQTEVLTANLRDPARFEDLLDFARQSLNQVGKDVTFTIDDEAFRDDNPDALPLASFEIRLKNLPAKAPLALVLRQALKQMPVKAALVVRAGRVDFVPAAVTSKEHMLNQTFHVDFSERKLDAALEELSELTGVSIIIDARAKQKMQTAVTARFLDDVALQDAVRMLTDMADLKIVYLVTGIYVTTPEHAKEMQKELRELYESAQPIAGAGGSGIAGPGGLGGGLGGLLPRVPLGIGAPPNGIPPDPGMMGPVDLFRSPLAPPLPPAKGRRMDPAAA